MDSDELLILAAFGGMAVFTIAIAVGLWKLSSVVKKRSDANSGAQAAARGWQTRATEEGGSEVRQWSGSTAGVAWTAEHRVSNSRGTREEYSRYQTRWNADAANGPATPILIVPERSSLRRLDSVANDVPAGFLRSLVESATDKVIDRYFGASVGAAVDLPSLVRVEGHGVPGATVLAARASEALLLMRNRLAPVLTAEASVFAGSEAPAVVLLPASVHLASRASVSTDGVDRLAQAGAAIVNALK